MNNEIIKLSRQYADKMIEFRRLFHQYPEIGYHEINTAKRITEVLDQLGIEYQTGVGETGVIGLIKGKIKDSGHHKVILLRSDMDALKLQELNETDFKSTHDGVMHACGHDGHMSWLLGAAMILNELRDSFAGTVKLVFQPAEEGLGGAKKMIEDGVLENPRPDFALGAHIWPDIDSGKIGVKYGSVMAAPTMFTIEIKGKGGHAAMPHLTVDPIHISNLVYTNMMQIISRKRNPVEPMVLSVTEIHGGTAHNIIPEKVVMKGTVRTITDEAGTWLNQEMKKVLDYACEQHGASYTFDFNTYYPPVINHEEAVDHLIESVTDLLGSHAIEHMEQPSMAGEDFSFYLNEIPGAFFMVGTRNQEKNAIHPLHSPYFTMDEDVLVTAAAVMAKAAIDYLMS